MNRFTIEVDDKYKDYRYVVVINHNSGCRCGYVGVDKSNKLYGYDYNDNHIIFSNWGQPRRSICWVVDVHGGMGSIVIILVMLPTCLKLIILN
jgi:hypothetical protein